MEDSEYNNKIIEEELQKWENDKKKAKDKVVKKK